MLISTESMNFYSDTAATNDKPQKRDGSSFDEIVLSLLTTYSIVIFCFFISSLESNAPASRIVTHSVNQSALSVAHAASHVSHALYVCIWVCVCVRLSGTMRCLLRNDCLQWRNATLDVDNSYAICTVVIQIVERGNASACIGERHANHELYEAKSK